MTKTLPNTKQGDTSKKTSITKHQVVTNNKMGKEEKFGRKLPPPTHGIASLKREVKSGGI